VKPTIASIQRKVAAHYGTPLEAMREPFGPQAGDRILSRPRQVAMCLAARLTDHSYARIGHFFGGRDHSTVIHGARRAEARDSQALRRLTFELLREMGK
jgi:chromosomal replication initiator protein